MRLELTDRHIANVAVPESGRIEISDTKRKGLRLRVYASGKKVWMYEKRVSGGPKRKHTLGSPPAIPLSEARRLALQIEAEASLGVDRVEEERQKKIEAEAARRAAEAEKAAQLPVKEVLQAYAELHLSQLRTGAERRRQLEQALAKRLDLPITELSDRHLQQAVDEKLLAGRKVFANRIRAALKAFAKWAWERGYTNENIGRRIAKATKETDRERVLSLEEMRAIFEAAGDLGPLWRPLIRLLILTGQRRGEIVGLTWEEVDLCAARITKPGTQTKNSKPHITHLSAPAIAELEAMPGDRRGLIFTTTGTTPVSGLSRVKSRLDAMLGENFEPWRFHDIRTAMATALAEAGEPEAVVDRILNHAASGSAPSAVARVYNMAAQLPQRAKALDKWAEMVTSESGQVVRLAR